MEYRIKMTKAQVEWAEWAIDPMEDYWSEQGDPKDPRFKPKNLPRVEGDILIIPEDPVQEDVVGDFLYRLLDQAGDMCEADANPGGMRSSENLAKKIMDATGIQPY